MCSVDENVISTTFTQFDWTDSDQTIQSYTVELLCEDSSTASPTASPTFEPTASPTGPTPAQIAKIFTEITTATTDRVLFWIKPYAGSEAAFIVHYVICIRVEDSAMDTEICDLEAEAVSADGTENYSASATYFNILPNLDYLVRIAAVNNYGQTAIKTEGLFSSDESRRRLTSTSNSTSLRQLTQTARYLLVQSTSIGSELSTNSFTFEPVEYNTVCVVWVTTNALNCVSEPSSASCTTYIDCPEVPQVTCDITDDVFTAEWGQPVTGNSAHILDYELATTGTAIGPFMCQTSSGTETMGCGRFIAAGGLDYCGTPVDELCAASLDQPRSDLDPSTLVSDVCKLQCDALEAMVGNFEGVVIHPM